MPTNQIPSIFHVLPINLQDLKMYVKFWWYLQLLYYLCLPVRFHFWCLQYYRCGTWRCTAQSNLWRISKIFLNYKQFLKSSIWLLKTTFRRHKGSPTSSLDQGPHTHNHLYGPDWEKKSIRGPHLREYFSNFLHFILIFFTNDRT